MSVLGESNSPMSKRSTSPRPPAVGEEVKKFNDTSRFPEPYKSWNMEYQQKGCYTDSVHRSVTPSCSEIVTESAGCTVNSPNPSPPPPYKWAQSLLCLLEDVEGVALFQQFLTQEGQDSRCLSFWFACRGVKKIDPNDREGLIKLIKVVFEKKVRRISAISDETKEEIRRKLETNTDIDDTIFDVAQREVETYMIKTTYPNFLKSDLYIQHLGGHQNAPSTEKDCITSPEPVDLLPTVHEDAELHIASSINKIPLTKTNLLQRNKLLPVSKLKTEGPAGFLQSPYSTYTSYHSKYGSFLPASAQDSELQSLSSDAQTDDTMSVTDSSVNYPTHSRSKQKHSQKSAKHNAILNKGSHGVFIPRTQRLPEKLDPMSKEFYALVVKKLNKVVEEQKMKEKIFERLKTLESPECSKVEAPPNVQTFHKSNPTPVFEPGFFCVPSEENDQDILDKHILRVFDSGQETPSAGCMSPVVRPSIDASDKFRVPLQSLVSCEQPRDFSVNASHKFNPVPEFITVPNSIRYRRDHDAYSTDSAIVDYIPDEMPSSYKSQYSCGNSELLDNSRRSRDHSKRYTSKKFSSLTGSSSSFVDSGISLACESVPSYSKVTHWLENKRISEQEREHMWRNSSTSPVLSRSSSSRKAIYNSSRCGSQDIGCSMWSGPSTQQIAQDLCMSTFPSDTTSNLLEARRRLEDESRAKLKLKCASGVRSSHDASRTKSSKGYDSFDDGVCHRKLSRKSCPGSMSEAPPTLSTSSDVTVIGYSYGRHSVPYLSKLPGKNITLRQFKSLLSKKGNFRYFFKAASNDFGTGVVFEEVNDDYKVLPMWEGKIFCVIENMDEN